uniref:Uncharacterized protein n=1 Tax=Anguilla anguilla TaxID=7936 RepID=A0A0E9VPX7_ANGAN
MKPVHRILRKIFLERICPKKNTYL